MSALEIRKRRPGEHPHFHPFHCENGCTRNRRATSSHRVEDVPLVSSHIVYIAGYPAAAVCKVCARQWPQMWDEALSEGLVEAA